MIDNSKEIKKEVDIQEDKQTTSEVDNVVDTKLDYKDIFNEPNDMEIRKQENKSKKQREIINDNKIAKENLENEGFEE